MPDNATMAAPGALSEAAPVPPAARRFPLKQALKILVGLGLMAFLLHSTGIENTIGRLSKANLWYIPLCIALLLGAQALSTYRWKFLGEALDFRLSLRELYDYYLIGMFSNQFLPGSIGGDAVRMVFLARRCQRKKREALLTILAERGVGLIALLLMTTLIAMTPVADPIPWFYRSMLLAFSLGGLAGFLVLRAAPLTQWAQRHPKLELLLQARIYWANTPLLARSIGISLVVHGVMVGMHVLVAQAMHVQVPVLYLAVVYGIVSLASVLPITQGGLGVRELAYQALLAKVGIEPATGLAFGVYWFLISILTSLIGGPLLLKGHYKPPSPQEADAP